MELRHLRYFVTAAEELHFARAAERLGIAPPTLTVQIQEIERGLAARLFTRNRRAVALTTAGEVFLAEARAVLARFAQAESAGRRAGRGEIGRIEIGYVGSAAYAGVLQAEIGRFRAARPAVEVKAREWPMQDLPALLRDGPVDIGFVRLPMTLPAGLSRHILVRDEFCVALPADHAEAAAPGPIRAARLAGEGFIVPEQDAGTQEVARRGRFTPRVIGAPGSLAAVLTQVSLGAGVSILPSVAMAAIRIPGIAFRALAGEPIPSEVAAIFRTREAAPAVRHFIGQISRSPPVRIGFMVI
ncbi:MAG TPA: LysR substrate-binding domain-containing protein [Roseomonas sp.]|jgi:DNA-binding transcriptional LysR family regulator